MVSTPVVSARSAPHRQNQRLVQGSSHTYAPRRQQHPLSQRRTLLSERTHGQHMPRMPLAATPKRQRDPTESELLLGREVQQNAELEAQIALIAERQKKRRLEERLRILQQQEINDINEENERNGVCIFPQE